MNIETELQNNVLKVPSVIAKELSEINDPAVIKTKLEIALFKATGGAYQKALDNLPKNNRTEINLSQAFYSGLKTA